jgi:serine/threonine-protein kinase
MPDAPLPPAPTETVTGQPGPAERLMQLWRQGQRPDVSAILAQAGPLPPAQVAEGLRAEQRQRWRAGERVPVEDYLARHPGLRADPEAALDLIFNEFLLREQLGERRSAEEFLRRFPQHAATLAEQIQLHRAMEAGPSALTRPPALAGDTLGAGPGPGRGGRR